LEYDLNSSKAAEMEKFNALEDHTLSVLHGGETNSLAMIYANIVYWVSEWRPMQT
jgi:hypothetical protein